MSHYISMRKFGKLGRFGNQVFQYMFLADYAKRYDLEVQIPPWVGNQLFVKQFSPITTSLPVVKERDETPRERPGIFQEERSKVGHRDFDYEGYAQYHTSYFAPNKDYLTSLFELRPEITERLAEPVAKLKSMSGSHSVVGVHLRRGDYGRGMFYITPVAWYLEVLEFLWSNLPNPVLFVSTETPELVSQFARFNPQTTSTLGIDLQAKPMPNCTYLKYDLHKQDPHQLDWVPDWVLLRHCNKLLIPNSTFSFSAALLRLVTPCGSDYQSQLRPTHTPFKFSQINIWDAQPMSYDKVEDYPEACAQGAKIDTNPYWSK